MCSKKGILDDAYALIQDEYRMNGWDFPLIEKIGLNPGWNTIITSRGDCGVAMSFRNNNPNYSDGSTYFPPEILRTFIHQPISHLIESWISSLEVKERSLCVAALNALSSPLIDPVRLEKKGYVPGADLVDYIRTDDIVALVGYGGLVNELASRCKELHVTDMRPPEQFRTILIGETLEWGPKKVYTHPETDNAEVLGSADVVCLTGSTLANGTFDEVIRYAKDARVRCLYGSTAQLLPDALFEHGINLVMSVKVIDRILFETDLMRSSDLETPLKRHQQKYSIRSDRLSR